jgi:zinc transport system ATP-binding protein
MPHSIHNGVDCHDACCLKVVGLGVKAGEDAILQDVDLHMHCGQIVALIGPNGAGKSTLFKAILGQMPHTGSIHFETAGGHSTRPLVGYVPQSPTFDRGDPVSVLDLFASAISRWPVFLPIPKALRAKVADCLARVQAEGLIDKRVGALSGGELQRVLLAMALEPLPHVLILDEPLSGVDVEGERQLLDMLDEIRRRYDLSILLSTHDFATLEQFADKVVLLRHRILKVGTPAQVLSSPEFQSVFHLSFGKGEQA